VSELAPPPDRCGGEPIEITVDMLAERSEVRVDFERGMSYAPPATLVILVAIIVVFGWQVVSGALGSQDTIVASGALVRERVLAGELWRLSSAIFLHGGAGHLFGNCVALYIVGMAGEHAVGARGVLTVYAASGISGSVASLLVGPGPSVGASGAIFGLMGAVIVVLYRYRSVYEVRDGRIGIVLAAWAAFTILAGLVDPMIDNAAHLGGLVGGMLTGWLVRPRLPAA
jgi:rhomboid protease GluP